jgi:hypothetical protein
MPILGISDYVGIDNNVTPKIVMALAKIQSETFNTIDVAQTYPLRAISHNPCPNLLLKKSFVK